MPKWWAKADYEQKISRKWGEKPHFRLIFGRDDRSRTCLNLLPNGPMKAISAKNSFFRPFPLGKPRSSALPSPLFPNAPKREVVCYVVIKTLPEQKIVRGAFVWWLYSNSKHRKKSSLLAKICDAVNKEKARALLDLSRLFLSFEPHLFDDLAA